MRRNQILEGITSVTIENFKAIRQSQKIEFRPITLLFGPNSAGKSTVIQAMQYMRELLERQNVDADRTIGGGNIVDLGGFRNIANHHDIDNPVSIRVDFALGSEELPRFGVLRVDDAKDSDLRKDIAENGLGDVESVWVNVVCFWDKKENKPWVAKYEVGLNGEKMAEISADYNSKPIISFVNFSHPLFLRLDEDEEIESDEGEGTRQQLEILYEKLCMVASSSSSIEGVQLIHSADNAVIPDFANMLPLAADIVDDEDNTYELFIYLMNQVLVGSGALLLKYLKDFRYLGPIRTVPPRNYMPQVSPDQSRWAEGLAAWDLLFSHYDQKHKCGDAFFKDIDMMLSSTEHLDLGYSIELKDIYEIPDDSVIMNHLRVLEDGGDALSGELFRGPLLRELQKIQPQRRLILHDEKNDTNVKPQDIGVGISQVLPVVVGAVDPRCSFFIVEQPELHIHPQIQCNLGDIFIRETNRDDSRVFLLETHSEHLILRMLRRIRETYEGELPPGKPELHPDQIAVYYLNSGEDGMVVTELPVTPDGDFARDWPQGFFEEREEELF